MARARLVVEIIAWLEGWGAQLDEPAEFTLIGLGGLLWHVNLMPDMVLDSLPAGWEDRSEQASYGNLTVVVPSPADLLAPKLLRKEPRDLAHAQFARDCGLIAPDHADELNEPRFRPVPSP